MHKQSQAFIIAALLLLVLALSGCTSVMLAGQPMMGGEGAQPLPPLPTPEPGKLTVMDVRARPAPLEGGNGATYRNGPEDPETNGRPSRISDARRTR